MSRRGNATRRVTVKRALFISAGRHHPQFMRPFGINSSSESIDDMLELLENRDFDQDSVGAWGGEMIYSQAQVEDQDEALIPHGWEGDRLRMFLHVEMKDKTFADHYSEFFVTGFTENNSVYEVNGSDDLDMEAETRIFINSIIRINRRKADDLISDLIGSGSSDDKFTIESNAHNLIAYTDDDYLRRDRQDFHTTRPYDIAARLDHEMSNVETDSRSDFTSSSTKSSSRGNMVANNYLGRVLGALVEGEEEVVRSDRWRNSTSGSRYTKAQRTLSENASTRCILSTELKNRTNMRRNGYITWEEAQEVFDGIDDSRVSTVMVSEEVELRSGRTSDLDGEKWRGSDLETVKSYQSMNSISGIMAECCIMQAHILARCEFNGGPIRISFDRGTAPTFLIPDLTEDQQEDLIADLFSRLKQLVFEPLAYTVHVFDLDANMDILGDSNFILSIQGEADADFWAPTFADGSTGGMVTSRRSASSRIGEDVNRLVDAIVGRN